MKKILFTASRVSHINNFHLPYLLHFKKQGYLVDVIAEGQEVIPHTDNVFHLVFYKKIISPKNFKTILQIRKILENNHYDLIISNSTLAGFLTRMALMLSHKKKSNLIHISHGYLFSKNTPTIKKGIYILAEKLCTKVTDRLLTMNQEDFEIAKQYKLCNYDIINIPGMGIPSNTISSYSRNECRKNFNFKDTDVVMVYPAEFSNRKNQIFFIQNFEKIKHTYPNIKLLLPGTGELLDLCKQEIKAKHLENSIFTPGYITNIRELLSACDIAISSSKSEGLPFNIMEAMSLGLPVIASDIKGHVDLITNGENGYLFSLNCVDSFFHAVEQIIQELHSDKIKNNNLKKINSYHIDTVFPQIVALYENLL